MSVRKRTWTTSKGEKKESWIVDYIDQCGERHIQTFDRKKDADEYHVTVKVDIRQGIHNPKPNGRGGGRGLDQICSTRRARAVHDRVLPQPC